MLKFFNCTTQLYNTEEVGADRKVKREASIADHTAATRVVLWEEHVNALEEGKSYHLKNFHIKEFQSRKHLSMPKNDFEITQIDNIKNTVDPPTDDEHTKIRNVCSSYWRPPARQLQVLSSMQGTGRTPNPTTGEMHQRITQLSNSLTNVTPVSA